MRRARVGGAAHRAGADDRLGHRARDRLDRTPAPPACAASPRATRTPPVDQRARHRHRVLDALDDDDRDHRPVAGQLERLERRRCRLQPCARALPRPRRRCCRMPANSSRPRPWPLASACAGASVAGSRALPTRRRRPAPRACRRARRGGSRRRRAPCRAARRRATSGLTWMAAGTCPDAPLMRPSVTSATRKPCFCSTPSGGVSLCSSGMPFARGPWKRTTATKSRSSSPAAKAASIASCVSKTQRRRLDDPAVGGHRRDLDHRAAAGCRSSSFRPPSSLNGAPARPHDRCRRRSPAAASRQRRRAGVAAPARACSRRGRRRRRSRRRRAGSRRRAARG